MANNESSTEETNIEFQKHETVESLLTEFWNFEKDENFVLSETNIGGTNTKGGEEDFTVEDMAENLRNEGFWGFADGKTNTVHYWALPTVDFEKLLFFFSHEIGHLTGTPYKSLIKEEARADWFGEVSVKAFNLVSEIKDSRPASVCEKDFIGVQQEFIAKQISHEETSKNHRQRYNALRLAAEKVVHLINCNMVYEKDAKSILKQALEAGGAE